MMPVVLIMNNIIIYVCPKIKAGCWWIPIPRRGGTVLTASIVKESTDIAAWM